MCRQTGSGPTGTEVSTEVGPINTRLPITTVTTARVFVVTGLVHGGAVTGRSCGYPSRPTPMPRLMRKSLGPLDQRTHVQNREAEAVSPHAHLYGAGPWVGPSSKYAALSRPTRRSQDRHEQSQIRQR